MGLALIDKNEPVRATRTLPPGYVEAGGVTLEGNRRLVFWMNMTALGLLALTCCGFTSLISAVRPELFTFEVRFASPDKALVLSGLFAGGALLTVVLTILAHELLHGAAFWFYTRARPVFGLKGWYAYASAPGWFFPRGQILVALLAPLVVISLGGVVGALFAPALPAAVLLFAAAVNTAGAAGDLYLLVRLAAVPATTVVEDRLEGITWYVKA